MWTLTDFEREARIKGDGDRQDTSQRESRSADRVAINCAGVDI